LVAQKAGQLAGQLAAHWVGSWVGHLAALMVDWKVLR
jgi:hypothetical protein